MCFSSLLLASSSDFSFHRFRRSHKKTGKPPTHNAVFEAVRSRLAENAMPEMSARTLHRYYNAGAKFAMLAGAGTHFMVSMNLRQAETL